MQQGEDVNLGASDELSEVSSATLASCVSGLSAADSAPKCFAHGTYFRRPGVAGLIGVEDLQAHEILVGYGDRNVEVAEVKCHASCQRPMVHLRTMHGELLVTADHRMVVHRGHQKQTIPAEKLCVGDLIAGEHGECPILEMRNEKTDDDVFQVTFQPDAEMETFYMPSWILTKGSKAPIHTRRSGAKGTRDVDSVSFEGTFDPYK